MIWTKYCGTAAKAGGNRENKYCPVVTEVSCLLEILRTRNQWYLEGHERLVAKIDDILSLTKRPQPTQLLYQKIVMDRGGLKAMTA